VRERQYELRVPQGTVAAVQAGLKDVGPAGAVALKWHTVRRGESLLTISRKLGVSRADLAEANYISMRARVVPGQKLVIPREPSVLLAARADRPVPVAESRTPAVEQVVAAAPDATRVGREKLTYRVKRGDTLFGIAKLFDTTVASLKSWNKLAGNRIAPGDRLTIFTSRTR
jgi:peptidoglycan lytic transglycosylase D